jgi:hypothetical protein
MFEYYRHWYVILSLQKQKISSPDLELDSEHKFLSRIRIH